jgi:hypothetical protein
MTEPPNIVHLARELRRLQLDWEAIAASVTVDTPNGQMRLTVVGDLPMLTLESGGEVMALAPELLR